MNYELISALLCLILLNSCNGATGTEKDSNYDKEVVISELMTDNETTLMNKKGKPARWIEIANISGSEVSLEGMQLMGCKQDSTENDTVVTWTFPDKKLAAGEQLVVFVGKAKKKVEDKADNDNSELKAHIKLPKKNGRVMLLTKSGKILSEMEYDHLECDQSMQRLEDGSFVKSDQPTPGFSNDAEGVANFLKSTADMFKSDLKIWELKSQAAAIDQWIEVKNTSNKPINLSEYFLTNKSKKLDKWQMPNVQLAPGAFYLVTAAGKKRAKNHTGWATFKLCDNDAVILAKGDKIVDAMSSRGSIRGGSRGRIQGKAGIFYFETATPNAENTQKGYVCTAKVPTIDKKAGVYKENQLTIKIEGNGKKVHYTTDGSVPTASSPVYSNPINLKTSTTVRYYSESDDTTLPSEVQTSTYLLGQQHKIAVLNITVKDADLWDPTTGIYVEGSNARTREVTRKNGRVDTEIIGANYLQKWTKQVHAELFDEGEGISVDCGLRIFGAGSRHYKKKSMSLKFDPAYGPATVDYDFFGDGKPVELEDIVVRSGSDDQTGTMVKDEFFTSLMQEESPTILTQSYRPIVLYVNCQCWGVFFLREKIDRHFVGRKLGVSDDDVSIMRAQIGEFGDVTDFQKIQNYVRTNDMSKKEAFDYVDRQVCLSSLIDQKIGEMYCGNTDIYNVRQVRARDKKGDNKWYFVYYDVDDAWIASKPMAFYLRAGYVGGGSQPISFCNAMVDRMLSNAKFREMFLEHLSHHMHKTFETKHVLDKFDKLISQIRPEMKTECEHWGVMKYDSWENHIKAFRAKAQTRAKVVLDDVKKEINITPAECKKYGL